MVFASVSSINKLIARNECLKLEKLLVGNDFEVYKELLYKEDKMRMLAARILLEKVLNRVWGKKYSIQDLRKNTNGKPILKGIKGISISHSNKMATVAASINTNIGIDIEKIGEMRMDDFDVEFSNNEKVTYSKLESENKSRWLYNSWTMKESVVKADGIGVVAIEDVLLDKHNRTAMLNGKTWYFKDIPILQNYSMALCTDDENAEVTWLEF